MFRYSTRLSIIVISLIITLTISVASISTGLVTLSAAQQKRQVTITTILDDEGDPPRALKMFYQPALQELRARHPDLDIKLDYRPIPYLNLRTQFLKTMANQTPVDIMTVDQIWLGEFVQKGFLTDLTNRTHSWGRESDWYPANWAGGIYNHKVYGISPFADIRGMWYWKDLLNKAGVNPDSLKTWDGYIASAKKLNAVLRPQGIEGVHLTGASHSPDVWYPYLWMLGGDIIKQKSGHPTKGTYWFPAYNSSAGVKAMEFIKAQIDAGIKPQKKHFFGDEFTHRKFAVMIEGSWMPNTWANLTSQQINNIGFIPMFPVPDNKTKSSTLMGGWELGIPVTSPHKNIAWEIIELMLTPEILSPWLAKQGFLPTQITLGQDTNSYADQLRKSIPFYDDMISMIPTGRGRPSIPEYQFIAEDVRQALDEVFYGIKDPKQALDAAAAKSAKVLGW